MKEGKIRFNTIFVSDQVPVDPRVDELKKWCERFQKSGLTPEFEGNYTGNLSFRSKEEFIITASGLKNKQNLSNDCFVYVKNYDQQSNTVYVEGRRQPSSESVMHYLIYKARKEVNAVFHGHNKAIVMNAEKLGLRVTEKEYESGTTALATEALKALDDNKLVVLQNHGFVSLGGTMKEAGELALATLKRGKELANFRG
ncbi:MAG TPA: class II aldolase/adducin family protein [Candidatus Bathyarchaeota archaeon]|nr:class II aldolase/adducin family protein [Candidatus Bathyarchaeota archaeon]